MHLKAVAEKAVAQIEDIVAQPISYDQRSKILGVVEQAIIDSIRHTSNRFTEIVSTHAGPKTDIAHYIAEEQEQIVTALIANLMGMR